jgi:hypothetical protein
VILSSSASTDFARVVLLLRSYNLAEKSLRVMVAFFKRRN